MKERLMIFLKGMAIGSANVIPGVSGGTLALLLGIFERMIFAFKAINLTNLRLLLSGRFQVFLQRIDFVFLIYLFAGAVFAVLSLARILSYLFEQYPLFIWAFFFGLILASAYYISKEVARWSFATYLSFVLGLSLAVGITLLNPGQENSHFVYLMLSGAAAIASMILPGLSGSYILLLMGNYQLVAIRAVNELNISIFIPFGLGMALGLVTFAQILSAILKRWHGQTMAALTGFVVGSLGILWPWKEDLYLHDGSGALILKKGEPITRGYDYFWPELTSDTGLAILAMVAGYVTIVVLENLAQKKEEPQHDTEA